MCQGTLGITRSLSMVGMENREIPLDGAGFAPGLPKRKEAGRVEGGMPVG